MKIGSGDNNVDLYHGDCLKEIKNLQDNSIDSIVTDPPYALVSIVKRFGKKGSAPAKYGKDGAFARTSKGFMGKEWDTGDVAFKPEIWQEAYRVLKPGGHLLSFGGTRTYHRMTCAVEDAGFEIRDCVFWIYGQGFPKSHDVSKSIDREAGVKRKVIAHRTDGPSSWMLKQKIEHRANGGTGMGYADGSGKEYDVTAPATDAAKQWEGWGTALKPSVEPIVLARKPLSEKTVSKNVLKWGTGAINIDGCRLADGAKKWVTPRGGIWKTKPEQKAELIDNPKGRFPANLIHDGSDDYIPSQYFYVAKASGKDKVPNSNHPTQKPLQLMRYLVRMVTPPGGTVLDMFAGTGTTGQAALIEGCKAVLIEREKEYIPDIRKRLQMRPNTTENPTQIPQAEIEGLIRFLVNP